MISDHDAVRMLIGAYVLGGLSDTDRRTLETHLPHCDECRAELARSAPLPGLLRRVPGAFPSPAASPGSGRGNGLGRAGPPRRVDGNVNADGIPLPPASILLEQARRAVRRGRARRLILVAASIVVLAGLGMGLLFATGQRRQPTGPTAAFSAAAGYAVSGDATLLAKPWGTAVEISMAHLPAQGPFVVRVSAADGRTEQACTWAITPTGRATVTGGTSLRIPTISTITVLDHHGKVLATARPN